MYKYWSESQKNPIHNENGSIEMSSQVKPSPGSRQTSRKQSNRKIITRGGTSLLKSLIKLNCDCSKDDKEGDDLNVTGIKILIADSDNKWWIEEVEKTLNTGKAGKKTTVWWKQV